MSKAFFSVGAAALIVAPAISAPAPLPAAKPSPSSLTSQQTQPVNDWNLEASLGKCKLTHTVRGTNAAEISLQTEAGTDSYVLAIAQRRGPAGIPSKAALKVDGEVHTRTYVGFFPGNPPYPRRAVVAGLKSTAIDAIGNGSEISINTDRGEIGPLPLLNAAQAVNALRRCEAKQLIEWGADPSQFEDGGAQPTVGDRFELVPQSVMAQIRYPQGPIEPLHYLVLSDTGVVERCQAVFGIPNSDFTEVVCASLLGRKVGEPAYNPEGKPVRSVIG
jgi:hypothetical protein